MGALILGVGPTTFAMLKIMKMHDAFGVGSEIVHVVEPMAIVGGT